MDALLMFMVVLEIVIFAIIGLLFVREFCTETVEKEKQKNRKELNYERIIYDFEKGD